MKTITLFVLLISAPSIMSGQTSDKNKTAHFPRHYISVNPLNIFLFQQVGITYEYKPGILGFGIYTGYIYPNHEDYSNYFIAGPTNYASLGDYSGYFIVPHVNVYLNKPKNVTHGGLVYFSFKMVYKNMHIDSTVHTAWYNEGDSYFINRKMIDKVNIYGGFIDFGYRYVFYHCFFDLNLGLGSMSVNHKMIIAGENDGFSSEPIYSKNPPRQEELHQQHVTVNFTLNFGVAF
jgi:hypothetical protein